MAPPSGCARLHLEQLPGYAPELTPDEGSWNYLKRVELGNRCCRDLTALAMALRRAKERLRHQRAISRHAFDKQAIMFSPSCKGQ